MFILYVLNIKHTLKQNNLYTLTQHNFRLDILYVAKFLILKFFILGMRI